MKIIKQSWEWVQEPDGNQMLRAIEAAGRTCYKSEDKRTPDSAKEFVAKMLKSGHHAMIEFAVPPPIKIITDRGVTHEIVRHRLFSFAQESTRYCNYGKDKFGSEITYILPVWFYDEYDQQRFGRVSSTAYEAWFMACYQTESHYMNLLNLGQSPQEARAVLPNSLKTEINICGNVREWRHFFTLRCSPKAHPQMQDIAKAVLAGFKERIPVIFDDIEA